VGVSPVSCSHAAGPNASGGRDYGLVQDEVRKPIRVFGAEPDCKTWDEVEVS